ncbi:COX15/CtaA family protein, partial [Dehalococcoidia bacterium]|nr:COX15/CtaA family protein [Dehalococcoidia bacterium]
MLSVFNSRTRYFNFIFILKSLVIFSIIDCIFQISLGGFVRVTSSGLGCPDWPLCYGQIIPPMNYHTLIEWGHRTSGAILGLSILLIVIVTLIAQRSNLLLVTLSISTLILVSIVGGIGGAVVLTELEPSLRTLHLFLAQLIILLLGLCYISINVDNSENIFKSMKIDTYSIFTGLAALSIIITLLSGSYAVWKGAGTVC